MKKDLIRNLVVFSILMENGEGLLGKAPSYISEKHELAVGFSEPEGLLDASNLIKFQAYCEKWKV